MFDDDYNDFDEKYDEVEEWKEEADDEYMYEDEEPEFMTARVLEGQEAHWSRQDAFGIGSTTAEGAFGKKLLRAAMIARSDDERFRDSVLKVCRDIDIADNIRDGVLTSIPNIKDIRYKNPVGVVVGYMAGPFIGKKLSMSDRQKVEIIKAKITLAKEKGYKVSELDIVRYGKFMNEI